MIAKSSSSSMFVAMMSMAASLLVMTAITTTNAQSVSVQLKPLRYCKDKRWWGCKTRGYPYGMYWENAGMSNDNQDKAFMGIIGGIPTGTIKYIAIFSSGQQGSSGGADYGNVVSGASSGWRFDTDETEYQTRTLAPQSVAAQFYNDQSLYLPQSETLYLTLFDAQFNHMASSGEKEDALNGYSDYLNSVVGGNWNSIEGIVMGGSSRGGCFVMRMAQKLRSDYPALNNAKIAIGSIDGVCKYTQDEFGTTSSTIDNPVPSAPSSYKAYKTNVAQQFSGHIENTCVWHLALGDEVTGVGLGVRAFTHDACHAQTCEILDANGDLFYFQDWGDMCHECAGREYQYSATTVNPMLDHFADCSTRTGWWNA